MKTHAHNPEFGGKSAREIAERVASQNLNIFAGPDGWSRDAKYFKDLVSRIEQALITFSESERKRGEAEVATLKTELDTWKEVAAENERARVRWMLETHSIQDKLAQMEKLVGGIDVDNPSAVDTLIDAMKIQKENYQATKADLATLKSQVGALVEALSDCKQTLNLARGRFVPEDSMGTATILAIIDSVKLAEQALALHRQRGTE